MNKICFDQKKWFLEAAFPGVRRCKRDIFFISKEIFKGKSKFQKIHIFESPGFGKILALDGIIQLSQSDEFIYHEVIAHIPLLSHSNPKKMLIVGGGDGGVLREAAKHPLKEIHHVEIDREIVELAKKHLGFISRGAFSDKRLKLNFQDGKKYIKSFKNYFDIIVVDSTDPVGPGKALFQGDFYKLVYQALAPEGIAIFQLGPFLDYNLIISGISKTLSKFFKYLNPVRLPMPSYSCGCEYCFLMASKKINPSKLTSNLIKARMNKRLNKKVKTLKYYTPEIHQASLVMPKIWQL